jgi:hypothetical protein
MSRMCPKNIYAERLRRSLGTDHSLLSPRELIDKYWMSHQDGPILNDSKWLVVSWLGANNIEIAQEILEPASKDTGIDLATSPWYLRSHRTLLLDERCFDFYPDSLNTTGTETEYNQKFRRANVTEYNCPKQLVSLLINDLAYTLTYNIQPVSHKQSPQKTQLLSIHTTPRKNDVQDTPLPSRSCCSSSGPKYSPGSHCICVRPPQQDRNSASRFSWKSHSNLHSST